VGRVTVQKERLIKLLEPPIQALGYELVDLEARIGGSGLLRIIIDQDAGINLDDCERVSRQLGAFLDVEAPIPGSYRLEVSSPGLDRPLRTAEHFQRFAGHEAKIRLVHPLEGRRNFRGRLLGLKDARILIDIDGKTWELPHADVVSAQLVPEF
jgi:ribosome maturation factor RimP